VAHLNRPKSYLCSEERKLSTSGLTMSTSSSHQSERERHLYLYVRGLLPTSQRPLHRHRKPNPPHAVTPGIRPLHVILELHIIETTHHQYQIRERCADGTSKLCLSGLNSDLWISVKCTSPRLLQDLFTPEQKDVKLQTSLSRNSSLNPSFQRISLA
jgi:hypothetical protein